MNENKYNEEKKTNITRAEKRKLMEEEEKMNKLREEELERKRQELKDTLFNDTPKKKNVFKREVPTAKIEKIEDKQKKDVVTRIILSMTVLFALTFLFYMIIDSVTKVDQLYQIINASLIFLIVICFVVFYKSRKNIVQIIASFLIVVLMGFNGAVMSNILALPKQETVPDFSGMTLTQAINWADANHIEYDQTFEHSDNVDKYDIISQDIDANTLLKEVDKINFEVSNGPDYNKEVIISDMTDWNIDEAVEVIDENLLNAVTVNFEENLDADRDTIIYQSKSGNMKRNDDLTFTVSLGNKENLTSIKLKNLKNTDLFHATLYLNRNAISYELKYEFSNKVAKGDVIKTSEKTGTELNPGDKITVTISKGKEIKVPELENMSLSEVTKWMVLNNLNINYSDAYDDNIKSGHVISANYKKGDIIEEETTVDIVVSKGKLKMKKFSSLAAFKTWAEKYGIKYEEKEEFDDNVEQGDIIKFSVDYGKKIKTDETLIVYVSKGKAIEVPDFNGKTESQIKKQCNSLGLNCTFTTEYSTGVDDGKLISQSVKAGEKVAKGDTINFVIATNNRNEVTSNSNKSSSSNSSSSNSSKGSSSGSSSSSSSSSSGSSSNNGSSSSSGGSTTTCNYYTFNLGAGNTGAQTKQIIQGSNPNLKFSWNPVSACSNGNKEPGTVCSSSVSDGSSVSSCTTITITYVN